MSSKVNKDKKRAWKERGWKTQRNLIRLVRKLDLDPDYREFEGLMDHLDQRLAASIPSVW